MRQLVDPDMTSAFELGSSDGFAPQQRISNQLSVRLPYCGFLLVVDCGCSEHWEAGANAVWSKNSCGAPVVFQQTSEAFSTGDGSTAPNARVIVRRDFRGDHGNGGIMRSPIRAMVLPGDFRGERGNGGIIRSPLRASFLPGRPSVPPAVQWISIRFALCRHQRTVRYP